MATELQRKAAKLALENLNREKPLTKGEILIQAGYSPETASNPYLIWETIGFQALLEEALPDDLLATKHREGLEATGLYGKDAIEHPDYNARHRYLETAYKLKGKMKDGVDNKTLIINISGETAQRYGLSTHNTEASSD